ncbi:MAG: FAD-binding oxidoreductase [Betaproteobacteria bacterium]|nr:FAD-binding oxidoreductase [Betaproteobacteria bacterium]
MPDSLAGMPSGLYAIKEPAALQQYLRDEDGETAAEPLAIVRPSNVSQLRDLVRWANDTGRSLVPVSSGGGPRRHADTLPSRPAIIVDLSSMNRVIHADGRDAIAVIEPGVTFPEFDAMLKKHGLRSFKPLLPRRNKSALTSYLEREPITSPHDHWDSEDPLGGVEVVFGSGETYRTGTAGIKGSLEQQLSRGMRQMMAVGPGVTDFLRVLQGSQGTLGIVAWASAYCERIPALEKAFFVGADSLEPLTELSYKITRRRPGGQLFIVNNVQLAMMCGGERKAINELAPKFPRWALYANLTTPDFLPEERMAFQQADFQSDAAGLSLSVVEQVGGYRANDLRAAQIELPSVFYKDRPLGAHREVFFLSQLTHAPKFQAALTSLLASMRSPAPPVAIYLQPRVHGTSCHFEFTFPFDPANAAAAKAATTLADIAARKFADAGGFFSRPYGAWSEIAFGKDRAIQPFLKAVKEMFDPNGVLNPGKLCF